jgi:dynactin complex subunit
MIDILGPEFLTLRSFELSIADQLQCDIIGDEAMRQLNMVPIGTWIRYFLFRQKHVLMSRHQYIAYQYSLYYFVNIVNKHMMDTLKLSSNFLELVGNHLKAFSTSSPCWNAIS